MQKVKKQQTSSKKNTGLIDKWSLLHIPILIVITFITFHFALSCDFLNWDDDSYVTNNELIQQTGIEPIIQILTNTYLLNYQPITLLAYKLIYTLFNLNPIWYHLINLLLHIVNALLLYKLLNLLFQNKNLSFLTALLWAIHPMQVESVVWISELKNMLFTFFGLASIIQFYKYYLSKRYLNYTLSLLFFLLSVLSKGIAVAIPLVFAFIILAKKENYRYYFSRISPFFILSIIFGLITIYAQGNAVNVSIVKKDAILTLLVASHGVVFYIIKTIYPFNLSTFYNYPDNYSASNLELFYFFTPLVIIGIAYLIYKYFKKDYIVLFGISFYVINIALLLQIIPVGNAVVADRYFYFASIGLFIILAYFILKIIENHKNAGVIISCIILIIYGVNTYKRTLIWENSLVLFDEIINKKPIYPGAEVNYINRGKAYEDKGDIQKAKEDYLKATEIRNNYSDAYYNLGNIYFKENNLTTALECYNFAIQHNPNDFEALNNKGIILSINKNYNEALEALKKSISLNDKYANPYNNIANIYIDHFKQIDTAFYLIQKSLAINPNIAKTYQIRAKIYYYSDSLELAINDSQKAISIDPKDNNSFIMLADIKVKQKDYQQAIEYCNKALNINPNDIVPLYTRAIAYMGIKDTAKACEDFKDLISKGINIPQDKIMTCK